MSYGQKLFVLINRMMSLGLKHPTEHTMTQIMSILHLAGKDENEVSSVKAMVFYKSLSDFKALLKSTRKKNDSMPEPTNYESISTNTGGYEGQLSGIVRNGIPDGRD